MVVITRYKNLSQHISTTTQAQRCFSKGFTNISTTKLRQWKRELERTMKILFTNLKIKANWFVIL